MTTPRIEINLKKIAHNAKTLAKLYDSKNIKIIGVTKSVCGNPEIAKALINSDIRMLGDSRLSNIISMREAGIKAQFLLLRAPMLSQAEETVKHAHASLNTEISVLKALSEFALKHKLVHQVILMVELGDLREGLMPVDIGQTIKELLTLKGIKLIGVGTNLACMGGIKPDANKMDQLSAIAETIEHEFGIELLIISGGNSSNYNWFKGTKNPGRVNNLRLGESIFLGRETLNREPIPGLFLNAFTLVAEAIEVQTKPSRPYGNSGQDAFGNSPVFEDKGLMRRVLLGIGLQDVQVSGLTPLSKISILSASSDHIAVDAGDTPVIVGQEISFSLNYGALLSAMTSPYVYKTIFN